MIPAWRKALYCAAVAFAAFLFTFTRGGDAGPDKTQQSADSLRMANIALLHRVRAFQASADSVQAAYVADSAAQDAVAVVQARRQRAGAVAKRTADSLTALAGDTGSVARPLFLQIVGAKDVQITGLQAQLFTSDNSLQAERQESHRLAVDLGTANGFLTTLGLQSAALAKSNKALSDDVTTWRNRANRRWNISACVVYTPLPGTVSVGPGVCYRVL